MRCSCGQSTGAARTLRNRQPNGADLVIRLLERQGIAIIAGIPGGANLPLYDALAHNGSIRHVLARHEQGAGFMAQGMARVTGRPAVFFATSGPGATNTLTAIADAKLDSVPVVCITGQVPLGLVGTDAFQEVDIYGMSLPVTKHNFMVRSVEELATVLPAAFRIAASGRPGAGGHSQRRATGSGGPGRVQQPAGAGRARPAPGARCRRHIPRRRAA